MTDKDLAELREKIRVIAGDTTDDLNDPNFNYLVARTVQVVKHAVEEAEDRGYVIGWNDACPEKMKATKRSYGFKNV